MQTKAEQNLISRFISKEKQERYLGFIAKEKNRHKFTRELYHFKDFNWKLFHKIEGSENERELVKSRLSNKKNISRCYVISANPQFDGRQFSVAEAIEDIVGQEATILIFGHAEVIYYEAEAFDGRYISI